MPADPRMTIGSVWDDGARRWEVVSVHRFKVEQRVDRIREDTMMVLDADPFNAAYVLRCAGQPDRTLLGRELANTMQACPPSTREYPETWQGDPDRWSQARVQWELAL